MTNNRETPNTADNVRIAVYDASDVPELQAARDATPKREYSTHNQTRVAYHEAVVSGLNGTTADIHVDALALGDSTDDTSGLEKTETLGNELFRTPVTDSSVSAQTLTATTFIDSTEANGASYFEAALVAEQSDGTDIPINRFKISTPLLDPKQQGETVTVTIEITQQDG